MGSGTDVNDAGPPTPSALPDAVAALARRVALLELRNGIVTDATLVDLTDAEVMSLNGGVSREDAEVVWRKSRADEDARRNPPDTAKAAKK